MKQSHLLFTSKIYIRNCLERVVERNFSTFLAKGQRNSAPQISGWFGRGGNRKSQIEKEAIFKELEIQLVQTILSSCVPFDVVPSLLIEVQRGIELQTTGVNPCFSLALYNVVCLSISFYLRLSVLYFLSLSLYWPSTIRIPFPSNYNSSPIQRNNHVFICRTRENNFSSTLLWSNITTFSRRRQKFSLKRGGHAKKIHIRMTTSSARTQKNTIQIIFPFIKQNIFLPAFVLHFVTWYTII